MPEPLKFEYSKRWSKIKSGLPPEVVAYLEQHDRELEDYLLKAVGGGADGAPQYAGIVYECYGTAGFDVVIPITGLLWEYGDGYDATSNPEGGLIVRKAGYHMVTVNMTLIPTDGDPWWRTDFSQPAGGFMWIKDNTATTIIARPVVTSVADPANPPTNGPSLSGTMGPVPIPADGEMALHSTGMNDTSSIYANVGVHWVAPLDA